MIDTIPKIFLNLAQSDLQRPALYSKDGSGAFVTIKWSELFVDIRDFALGLIDIGITRGSHIGIIADNRKEWITADLGILAIGASDVPRGSDSTAAEVHYILNHADCTCTLVEDKTQLDKILSIAAELPNLRTVIVMDSAYTQESSPNHLHILPMTSVKQRGQAYHASSPETFGAEINKGSSADLATLIYTSGTTGEPKGVMLSHGNFMHQIRTPLVPLDIRPGDIFFSVLPIWHSFERSVEYVALFAGCALAYSKPIGKVMLQDMARIQPAIFPSVPRIWLGIRNAIYKKVKSEGALRYAIFSFFITVGIAHAKMVTMFRGLLPRFKRRLLALDMLLSFIPLLLLTPFKLLGNLLVFNTIKKRLGGRFKFGVSGGGALPPYIDDFFSGVGVCLLEGYGLTEAAPIVSVRDFKKPVPKTIGRPLPEVTIKILDEQGAIQPVGKKGILWVKGPNVMQGYYKKPQETAAVLQDGWLNTGDLALETRRGNLKIIGRAKNTIVLLGGENIEPEPIEDTILPSDYIDQVMVIGQDQPYLAALVVPNYENLKQYAQEAGINFSDQDQLAQHTEVNKLIMSELNERINHKKGFKLFERINKVYIVTKPLEAGVEMTHSLKLKRNVISEIYKKQINLLFKN